MARQLKATHPKRVEVLFDVSGSMENLGVFAPMREALIPLLREGLAPGDEVTITAFDTDVQRLLSERLKGEADVDAVIDALPGDVTTAKTGTNIRRPHHMALRRAEQQGGAPTFVILVSDSYNDTPAAADPAWPDYQKYYTLDRNRVARLTEYPPTGDNRDYERLLRRERELRVTTWGIGIEIDPATGRPRERLPRTPEMRAEEPPPVAATTAPERPAPAFPWPWLALIAVVAAALLGWWLASRPVRVSLSEGPKQRQNYSLRPREAIMLGGTSARGYEHGYAIPGPREPAAYLERGLRGFSLRPGEAVRAGEATVFLNNEELQSPRPVDYSDDIKIRARRPGEQEMPAAEHRLQFGRAIEEGEV